MTLWVIGCATVSSPQGGPKDSIPPKVLASSPNPYATNFNGKRVQIDFDEYVVLKDQSKLFFVSPQMEKSALLSTKGKSVVVDFQDTLLADQTYRLDFGASIVDNNEGNRLTDFTLTFATGDRVDSLIIVGQVVDALTRDTIVGAFVPFFDVSRDSTYAEKGLDSTILQAKAEALFRADSSGYFVADILKGKDYRAYAFVDYNGNQLFENASDLIAFSDTTFNPLYLPDFSYGYDSSAMRMYIDTVQVTFETFMEDPPVRQRYKSSSRPQKGQFFLEFASKNARTDSMVIDSLPTEWIVEERSAMGDTLIYWINTPTKEIFDSLRDTMSMAVVYYVQDSLFQDEPKRDTLKMIYTPPVVELSKAEQAEQKRAADEARREEKRQERADKKASGGKKGKRNRGDSSEEPPTERPPLDSLHRDSLGGGGRPPIDSLGASVADSLGGMPPRDSMGMARDSLATDSLAVEKPKNPFKFDVQASSELNPENDIIMTFGYPLRAIDSLRIKLVQTTVEKAKGARRDDESANIETKDTVKVRVIQEGLRRLRLKADWVYGADYELKIADSVFTNFAWESNDSLSSKFKVMDPDNFGTIVVSMNGAASDSLGVESVEVDTSSMQYIVELVKIDFKLTTRGPDEGAEKTSQTVLATRYIRNGEDATFRFLKPEKYYIRIIEDANGDSLWTTGVMETRLQPEKSRLVTTERGRPKPIEAKEKWEIVEYVDPKTLFAPKVRYQVEEAIVEDEEAIVAEEEEAIVEEEVTE